MSFSRPIKWYHSHADPIWPDGTFNIAYNDIDSSESEVRIQDGGGHSATQSRVHIQKQLISVLNRFL